MIEKIQNLKEKYVNAQTDEERERINNQISELSREDENLFVDAMMMSVDDTARKATQLSEKVKARNQLGSVIEVLPLSYIATHYFNKSRSWLYQKLNGYNVNGKPACFSEKEKEIFNFAVQDLSKKIGSVAIS